MNGPKRCLRVQERPFDQDSDPKLSRGRKFSRLNVKNPDTMKIRFYSEKPGELMSSGEDWNGYLEKVGQSQDKQAFAALFTHFSPLLKAFLMKSGGQNSATVEELVQETWIKVWRKAPHFSSKQGSASTWIYTIARNTRIDSIRAQARRNPDMLHAEDIYADNDHAAPHERLVQFRDKRNVTDALKALPPEQSEVLAMMYFQGKSGQQVAEALNLPLGTVKSRVRLALAKLKVALPDQMAATRNNGASDND